MMRTLFQRSRVSSPRKGDYGTTIIVPDCSLVADLGKAVEKWWWPLLMQDSASQKLTIELIEDDGTIYEVNPQSRGSVSFISSKKFKG